MSLDNTREIKTVKIVMLTGGEGSSTLAGLTDTDITSPSNGQVLEYDGILGKWGNKTPTGYNAGSGIDITNNAIVNTRKGALTGIIDSISSGYAHTQMTGARDTFTAGALIVVQSEASGSATNLRIQYGAQASDSQDFRFYDTAGQTTTLTIASGETINAMIDPTGYRAIVLSQYKAVAVDANTGTPTAELKKLKVGGTVYNADAIKHYSATAISSGSISVSVPNAGHLNGEIIAVNTGSYTGTTSNAWTLALSDGMTIEALTVSKADGTAFTDALTANELLFIKCNTNNDTAVLLGIAGASSGMPENPLATSHGGTGNANGFIRTGAQSGSTVGTGATIEGHNNIASGNYSHVEGHNNTVGANAHDSHAGGQNNTVNGAHSHVSGSDNVAGYSGQMVIGTLNNNKANTIFEVGDGTSNARKNAFEVYGQGYGISTDDGNTKIRFGKDSSGNYGYYKGNDTTLNLFNQGGGGLPEDPLSITHGGTGNSVGYIQTGRSTQSALGTGATREGDNNTGAGTYCHAEGYDNSCGSNASYSHVEGQANSVSGTASHAEGYGCSVSGNYSHAGGYYSTVGYQNQTAVGKYNSNKSGTLFEVGNGSSSNARSNAFEVYSDGKISCDNGSSKFQFTQNNGTDGYYDASGTFHAFGSGGGGSTMSKTRYTISSSYWSASANADGFYTLTSTLNPAIGSSPDVYVAGSADGTQPTDTEKGQFAYVKRCKVNGSTLTLYASSKPSSTFYIWVEGVNGTGSGDIVGNVIQPNGAVSGGGETYSTTEEVIGTWGNKTLYRKVYDFGALPNTGTKEINDTDLIGVKIKKLYGIANSTQNYVCIPLPFLTTGSSTAYVQLMAFFAANNSKIRVVTGEDRSNFDDVWIVVEYTKS